jgi:hypothetical protein
VGEGKIRKNGVEVMINTSGNMSQRRPVAAGENCRRFVRQLNVQEALVAAVSSSAKAVQRQLDLLQRQFAALTSAQRHFPHAPCCGSSLAIEFVHTSWLGLCLNFALRGHQYITSFHIVGSVEIVNQHHTMDTRRRCACHNLNFLDGGPEAGF